MPPTAKITKPMILNTVMEITRDTGFDAVNARSIAHNLNCSTRPIFTCYANMEELKKEFLDFAYDYFEHYVTNYRNFTNAAPSLIYFLSYIDFAKGETQLFKLLFMNDTDLEMREAKDFYRESDYEKRAMELSEALDIDLEQAKAIFLDLFLYSHGIAVLAATRKLFFNRNSVEAMLENILQNILQESCLHKTPAE